ncbi:hypothetical protein [Niallia sp. FSL R7-0271]|uniref:hypothetical protein n=1 Tax=Niallia sp. FSL R7-0271 TaxID=2921678 RepID=UPI0030F8F3AF
MEENIKNSDIFERVLKGQCKINNISTRKPKVENINNLIVVSVKNHLKEGVDFECFKILNLIYQIISPIGVKFNQQLYLYPDSKRVDRVTVSFEVEEYKRLNNELNLLLGIENHN